MLIRCVRAYECGSLGLAVVVETGVCADGGERDLRTLDIPSETRRRSRRLRWPPSRPSLEKLACLSSFFAGKFRGYV